MKVNAHCCPQDSRAASEFGYILGRADGLDPFTSYIAVLHFAGERPLAAVVVPYMNRLDANPVHISTDQPYISSHVHLAGVILLGSLLKNRNYCHGKTSVF